MKSATPIETNTTSRDVRACPRCGVFRQVRSNRPNSPCRDCRDVLSVSELRMWAA